MSTITKDGLLQQYSSWIRQIAELAGVDEDIIEECSDITLKGYVLDQIIKLREMSGAKQQTESRYFTLETAIGLCLDIAKDDRSLDDPAHGLQEVSSTLKVALDLVRQKR